MGKSAQAQFSNLNPGDTIALGDGDWTIAGVFESQGSFHESTLIAHSEAVLSAFKRNSFNSVTVLLDSRRLYASLRRALAAIPASTSRRAMNRSISLRKRSR